MTTRFRIELLGRRPRSTFACGDAALDRYFAELVSQDIRRGLASCFVVVDKATERIAGFYTLAATSIAVSDLPDEMVRRLPRYPTVPAALVGRLAIDLGFKRQGLGRALLGNAAARAARSEVAAYALVVDAANGAAAAYYAAIGFRPLATRATSLFLPLALVAKALPTGDPA
ncbi:MAG: GNAT family N-acetyltransferase [Rhodospirillales bacterium]